MDWHVLLITCVMIVLDILLGFAGAVKRGDVESGKLREGLWHKAGYAGIIVVAYLIQYAAQYAELGFEVPTVMAVCVYVILTEIVSVVENLCVLNPALVNSPLGVLLHKNSNADGE